jgi:hypothetical protein
MTLIQEIGKLIVCRVADVQNYIIPSGFSIRKECQTPVAVTNSQALLVLGVDVITDFVIPASRVLLTGSL